MHVRSLCFTDSLHLVIDPHNYQLLLIRYILLIITSSATVWIHFGGLFRVYHIHQLHGNGANSIHFGRGNISKEGKRFKGDLYRNDNSKNRFLSFQIRKISLTAAILMMWIVFFALDRVFPAFLGTFGLHYSFYILAAMSLSNAIFGIFCIPETKGKTHEEIMELLEQQAFKSH